MRIWTSRRDGTKRYQVVCDFCYEITWYLGPFRPIEHRSKQPCLRKDQCNERRSSSTARVAAKHARQSVVDRQESINRILMPDFFIRHLSHRPMKSRQDLNVLLLHQVSLCLLAVRLQGDLYSVSRRSSKMRDRVQGQTFGGLTKSISEESGPARCCQPQRKRITARDDHFGANEFSVILTNRHAKHDGSGRSPTNLQNRTGRFTVCSKFWLARLDRREEAKLEQRGAEDSGDYRIIRIVSPC